MKKRINQATQRKLNSNFDKSFWNKFDSKFSKKNQNEQNWQRLFAPLVMATVLILLTVNLYTTDQGYSEKEIDSFLVELEKVEEILDSVSYDLDDDFYAFTD